MMMDFGQTVEQISDKSGFSQSTIRRRIKLLELNRDNFKKAEKRGATLSDFAQLDKIEDLEAETGYWKPSVRRTSTGPCRMRWSSRKSRLQAKVVVPRVRPKMAARV